MKELGNRIRTARENAELTQEALAEFVGVSRTAVSRWETGESEPKLVHLTMLSELLQVSTDFLLGVRADGGTPLPELSSDAVYALKNLIEEIRKG